MLDDETGETLEQRSDDNEAALRTRLETYHSQSAPIMEHYLAALTKVDANQDAELVWKAIEALLVPPKPAEVRA